MQIDKLIEELNLEPHPEGGYYRETYRSAHLMELGDDKRNAGTGIYYMLTEGIVSSWHKVSSDEIWHFYAGETLVLEQLSPEGYFYRYLLGTEWKIKAEPQVLVPAGWWQRAYSSGAFTLVGCTVTPGFDFKDFEMLGNAELSRRFPEQARQIQYNPFQNE